MSSNYVSQIPFNPTYRAQVINDLDSFISQHSNFKMELIHAGGHPFIQLMGSMPLTSGNINYNIHLAVQIHEAYPIYPPNLFFIPLPGQVFNNIPNLQPNGAINTPGIFMWNPQILLNDTFNYLRNYFSNYPPLNPDMARRNQTKVIQPPASSTSSQNYGDQLMSEAQNIISECNDKSEQLYNLQIESAMLNHLKQIKDQISSAPGSGQKQKVTDKYIKPDLYPLQANLTIDIQQKAKECASQKTIDSFREAYINDPSIDINQFVSEYKDMCNSHFKNFVWPRLNK